MRSSDSKTWTIRRKQERQGGISYLSLRRKYFEAPHVRSLDARVSYSERGFEGNAQNLLIIAELLCSDMRDKLAEGEFKLFHLRLENQ